MGINWEIALAFLKSNWEIVLAFLKWIAPAAIGSGFAVFIDRTENATRRKLGLFLFGATLAAVFGGGMIEYWNIQPGFIQASIYMGWGLWGVGIVIQVTHLTPEFVRELKDRLLSRIGNKPPTDRGL